MEDEDKLSRDFLSVDSLLLAADIAAVRIVRARYRRLLGARRSD